MQNKQFHLPVCSGEVKSADCPTMDDPTGNGSLKSSGGMKQKKDAEESALPLKK